MGQATGCLGDDWTVSFRDDESVLIHKRGVNQKTVAVTGANGFIGAHIVKQLLAKGYKVRGTHRYDDDKVGFLTVLPNAVGNLTLHKRELVHDCFDDVFQGCDCVFHVASPTLKDQSEFKNPYEEMITTAVEGTKNILRSSKKKGVSTVVLTSSMCTAIPQTDLPPPAQTAPGLITEALWADPDYLMDKGSYYAASKTLAEKVAVEFELERKKDSAFRLVRICPTFTVGPMLQPTLNSSMERFARICAGTHHKQIPNRSISLVDVRDTAAHHIAAYERGHPGRFFSLTEGWHWTLVYDALKIMNPEMKCPKPLPSGTKHRPVRKYSTSRIRALRVPMRSFMQTLRDAFEEQKRLDIPPGGSTQCHKDSGLSGPLNQAFITHAGYYKSVAGDMSFFMIEVISNFETNKKVGRLVFLSWFFPGEKKPTCLQVFPQDNVSFNKNKLLLPLYGIDLTFFTKDGHFAVKGTIGKIEAKGLEAISYVSPVRFAVFPGTYMAKDGRRSVKLTLGDTNSTITDDDGNTITNFIYNSTKRLFEYTEGSGNDSITSRLYLNAAAGYGLRLTFVRFNPAKLPGTTKFFYLSPKYTSQPEGPSKGVGALARFGGFYPLNVPGSFVSIVGTHSFEEVVLVGICTDGVNSTEYTSFDFDIYTNTLTFPQDKDLTLTFEKDLKASITKVTFDKFTGLNHFAVAPLIAFGSYTLNGTDPAGQAQYSLQIMNGTGGLNIVYTKNGKNVFDPKTMILYNAVEQDAKVLEYVFNFTYNADKGISCGVTTVDQSGEPTGLQSVLFAFQLIE